MLRYSGEIDQLANALSAAQGVMEGASKDKTNPHFKSKYADLGSVWDAIRQPLAKNGLSVIQLPYTDDQGRVHVSTMLMHKSGQWIEASYFLQPTKNDPQGLGSAITYMKRYALTGMGVAPEDDDGNDASRPAPPLERPRQDDRIPVYDSQPKNGNGDPRAAAIRWADEALKTVRGLKTANELRSWEMANEKAMAKLKTVDEPTFYKFVDKIAERFTELKPSTLSAG